MQWSYIHVPLRYGQGKLGVDQGPTKLNEMGMQQLLPTETVKHTIRVLPESEIRENEEHLKRVDGVLHTVTELAEVVHREISENRFPLIVGGDHSMAIGTLAGLAQTGPYGVIWVDAHADLNTGETSPSGNIHGMPLAAAMGMGDVRLTEVGGRDPKLSPEHLVYIALRDIDEGEMNEINRLGIKVITVEEVRTRGVDVIMKESLSYLRERVDRFYISFDMDSLDASLVPGTGTPVDGGLTEVEAKAILKEAMQAEDLIAVELVELNPALDRDDVTAQLAYRLCETIIKSKENLLLEGETV
ncbi:arginase [Exiguobacterium profundum]|uniref:arginase n=1 Tax=Exiguobacterium TaxID=33986 RepID=UPI00093FF232|nr:MULTISPECIES: arginase [Exiguobacterium]QPI67859.1 arginase [Exiguobacterium sp. PBE]MBG0918477.1 arginase [Exiguobacterium sp. SRB7LM]MCT4799647.1 arginase [Exiguobacterium profundum]MCV9900605.1 arginase [Exiguobacterium sp. N5]MDT0192850.1 arginase [Exiguobacterium sp. BG5(2022)]